MTSRSFAAVLPHVGVFGGVRRFLELGNELGRRGHAVTVIHPEGTAPGWMPFSGRTLRAEEALRDTAAEYDVAMCGDPGVFDLFERVRAKFKVLWILGQRYADKYRAFYRPGLVVVGVNTDWTEYLPGIPGHTVPGGINLADFRPRAADPRTGGPLRVLGFCRMEKKVKGMKYLLAAMVRLGRGARLVLYDTAPLRLPWWARLCLTVEAHVGLSQAALAELYAGVDIFVSAELSAGWSNPVAEAMASRVPVVCTPAGSAALARDGETALVVPRRDAGAIARALRRLRDDPELRGRLAEAGFRRVQEFSWARTCDRLLEVLIEHGWETHAAEVRLS